MPLPRTLSPLPHSLSLRIQSAATVALIIGSAHLAIWFPYLVAPKVFLALGLLVAVFLVANQVARSTQSTESSPTILRSWFVVIAVSAGLATALIAVCSLTGAWHGQKFTGLFDKDQLHWVTVKLPTVITQQVVLQWLIVPLLLVCFGKWRWAIISGALIFASLHFPNPVLMLVTLMAGFCWIAMYAHYRRLAPVIVSHFVLAILAAGLCGEYIFNLRVGPASVELFPKRLEIQNGQMVVFPAAITGCVENVVQRGDELVLEGWVVDGIHAVQPESLVLVADSNMYPLNSLRFDNREKISWPKNAQQSGFNLAHAYGFEAVVPIELLDSAEVVEIYAKNTNGWYSRLGRMGQIKPIATHDISSAVQVFPTSIDGRIHYLDYRNGSFVVRGWLANIQEFSVLDNLWIRVDGHWQEVLLPSQRKATPYVAESFDTQKLSHCGFEVAISNNSDWQTHTMEFFAKDRDGVMHQVPLSQAAAQRIADKGWAHDASSIR